MLRCGCSSLILAFCSPPDLVSLAQCSKDLDTATLNSRCWPLELICDQDNTKFQRARHQLRHLSVGKIHPWESGYKKLWTEQLQLFPNVHTWHIFHSNLTHFTTSFLSCVTDLTLRSFSGDSLPKLPDKLRYLRLEHCHTVVPKLPEGLLHFSTHSQFWDQCLDGLLPDTLQELEIGYQYTTPIVALPSNLRRLCIRGPFNHPLSLPSTLRSLHLDPEFQHPVNLPSSLTDLSCYFHVDEALAALCSLKCCGEVKTFLPNLHKYTRRPCKESCEQSSSSCWPNQSLERISVNTQLSRCLLNSIPNSVRHLKLSRNLPCNPLERMISSLTRLDLQYSDFNWPLVHLPVTLTTLCLPDEFNSALTLPSRLTVLDLRWSFNQPLVLPGSLLELGIFGQFNQCLVLPSKLTSLDIRGTFSQRLHTFPDSLTSLTLGDAYRHAIFHLPLELRQLRLGHGYPHLLLHENFQIFLPACNPTFEHFGKSAPPNYSFSQCSSYDSCKKRI